MGGLLQSVVTVAELLEALELKHLEPAFRTAGIDGPVLLEATDESLAAIGIAKPEDRAELLWAIDRLRESAPPPPDPTTIDPVAQALGRLRELKQLHEANLVDDAEFRLLKTRILLRAQPNVDTARADRVAAVKFAKEQARFRKSRERDPNAVQIHRGTAIFLAVALGPVGADRFYAGHFLLGFFKLAVSFIWIYLASSAVYLKSSAPGIGYNETRLIATAIFAWVAWCWYILDIVFVASGHARVSGGVQQDGKGRPIEWV
jgi:hypothetical protein